MKRKRDFPKGFIVCLFLLIIFLMPNLSFGATFCVSNATELQAALTTAESNGEDNTIQIVQGTYNGNFTYASTEAFSLTVEGGYTENCASRTINPANTILDGGGSDMVLALVSQGAANFSVEGLTVQNGETSSVDNGGGLYITTSGSVTLTNNNFTGNTANNSGGGVYTNTGGLSTLTNNTFTDNTAMSGGGSCISSTGTASLTDNSFTENTTTANGGGVYIRYPTSGIVTLTNNTFTGNTARSGGGTYILDYYLLVSGPGTLTGNTFIENTASENGGGAYVSIASATLIDNTFSNNTAATNRDTLVSGGGGAYVYSGTLTSNTFINNTANTRSGGGVYMLWGVLANNTFTGNTAGAAGGAKVGGSSTLTNNTFTHNTASGGGGGASGGGTLTNNTFSENTATNGGGFSGSGTLTSNTFTDNTANTSGGGFYGGGTLINNIFTGNTATTSGGGGYILFDGDVILTNNTITGNTSDGQGGGVWLSLQDYDFTGSLYNNIIWNNTAPDGADLYIDNTGDDPFFPVTVNLFNNDFDQSSSGIYMAEPFTIDSSNLDNEDPLFVGSGDYHLTASSPCINTGDNDAPGLPTTDKDGNPRIMGGTVDMGAYEYQTTAYVNKDDDTCGGKSPCYMTIQEAIDASSDGTLIRIVAGNYEENITLNASKTLTLKGGYDSAFTAQLSDTTIKGSLVVSDGKLKTSKIKVHYQK